MVLVLADGVSWHDYPDCALLGGGAKMLAVHMRALVLLY